ncbi:MAG: hypothetical protein HY335_05975 [Deinococcus sp.]|nr:hypothetical protein [Deinococcus sp.]
MKDFASDIISFLRGQNLSTEDLNLLVDWAASELRAASEWLDPDVLPTYGEYLLELLEHAVRLASRSGDTASVVALLDLAFARDEIIAEQEDDGDEVADEFDEPIQA